MKPAGRPFLSLAARLLAGVVAVAGALGLVGCEAKAATVSHRWPKEIVEQAATLPVQEGGRVMPLETFAEYTVLQWNARRSVLYERGGDPYEKGEKVSATEVLLDVAFRPEVAARHPLFVVDNDEVLDAIGVSHERRSKRDHYSLRDLADGWVSVFDLAEQHRRKDAHDRTPVEDGIIALADHLESYKRVRGSFAFAAPIEPHEVPAALSSILPGKEVRLRDVIGAGKRLLAEADKGESDAAKAAREILTDLTRRVSVEGALRLVPPVAKTADEPLWLRPNEMVAGAIDGEPLAPAHLEVLDAFERFAAAAAEDAPRSGPAFSDLHERLTTLARARGEYEKIPMEVGLQSLDPFGRAFIGYLVAFLLAAATWLWRSRPLTIVAWSVLLLTLALHVTGIVIRCLIRERPPMLNLYDTTLFVSAVVVAAACVVEMWTRMRVAFALAPLAGALLLLVSQGYETILAEDTMRPPIAVLDTNFWLATHVVCIATGYSASLAAALFAHVHVLGRVFHLRRGDPDFYRAVSRMGYGVLCFALLFSLVGTILGGIWANESWGRFWGWDPKENGALMICLVQLATLHARMGGLVRSLGVSILTIFCGMVVAFSWWGVNLLEVGLHSYGFTKGLWTWIFVFWGIESAIIVAGIVRAVRDGTAPAAAAS